ncbi:retrovirus-related pol polyprotein from transposon TNT 1-94 [Tanacetum coccineum]|uniref:Retrovirus-related pol polyprotein from transposon TNT 1-94 n=1 Tax=Tanacetum coccineum TaxID=301880 RepID=A0ABQ5A554_9ASTR
MLMQGSDISQQERHLRLMSEFEKFVAMEGESLTSVYERFLTLINVIDRNNEYTLKTAKYDQFYDHLSQFEPHVNASRAKKAARNHDLLALVANSHVHSLNSHAGSIQGECTETTLQLQKIILLARATPNRYSTPTPTIVYVHLSSTENNTVIQDGPEQMLLATKDEAGVHLDEEENDFMLDNAYGNNTLEELYAAVIMMARIQPTDEKSEKSDLPLKKKPNESKLLKLFVNLDKEIKELGKLINISLKSLKKENDDSGKAKSNTRLPPEAYALVSNHKVAKEIWERIQLLMQGTSLTKQERECKLYDEFDKFAYKKRETLLNTKSLNTLPPEWSKFVTNVKLVQDLHTTNIDQLHAYLEQHEFHANEVRLMHERNSDPLALVATHQMTQSPYQTHQNTQFQQQVLPYQSPQYGSPYQSQQYSTHQSSTPLSITYPSNEYQSLIHHNVYSPSSSIPQLEYSPLVNQQSEFSQPDSGLIVLVFQKGDDPIDAINHMMSFLTVVVTSRYPTTNNQLRNSSNPRQINNGRVTLQPIQGRQTSLAAGTSRTYTPGASGSNSGKQRTVICYNCKGEGHMSKQCTKPKRKRDDSWFKDKVLLVQAQASGQILHEEELAFLADPGIPEGQSLSQQQTRKRVVKRSMVYRK